MAKVGAVRQREYEKRKKEKTRRHAFKNDVIKKENKENYSKLTKRNMKLRSLKTE